MTLRSNALPIPALLIRCIKLNIIIKNMETDAEIKGKAFVHWKAWQQAYRGIVDDSYLDNLTLQKCEDIAYKWTENIIVAKNGERVVGFAAYGKYRNDEFENTGEIYAIYVLADYYGKGVGHMLMKEALERISEFPRVALWVLKDNGRAISFYKKFGFRPDGREEILTLGSPVTEIRMILDIGKVQLLNEKLRDISRSNEI